MKNKRVLMLLALTVVLSVSMTACSFGGGSDEDSSQRRQKVPLQG